MSIIKAHCPTCGAERNSEIVAEYEDKVSDDRTWTQTDHRILKCCGCDTVFHQTESTNSEDIEHDSEGEIDFVSTIRYWPAPLQRTPPAWVANELWLVDKTLDELMSDVYRAIENDLRVFAAIGLRTLFDRASELLDVDPTRTFSDKLKQLVAKGRVSPDEKAILDVLTDAGNAAAHRGWSPSIEQLNTLVTIAEQFVHRAFVLEAEARMLRTTIPRRPPKVS